MTFGQMVLTVFGFWLTIGIVIVAFAMWCESIRVDTEEQQGNL
jgi:hypothetical protein